MQPATISAVCPASTFGSPATSKMASMLSSVAACMNEQVFTTTALANSGSSATE